MKYFQQFGLVLIFALLGEFLHWLLPIPFPASIYGLVLLFLALSAGIVKEEQIHGASGFLLAIMSVMFIAPTVNLMDSWSAVAPVAGPVIFISVASTLLTFAVGGLCTQWLLDHEKKGGDRHA